MDNHNYSFRVVWSADDEAYVATCPEVQGVSGVAAEPEAAITEARQALELALETFAAEGWDVPEPEDAGEYSGQFRLRLAKSLHAQLAMRAADEQLSLNSYAATLIAMGLGDARARAEVRRETQHMLWTFANALIAGPPVANSLTPGGTDLRSSANVANPALRGALMWQH